MRGRVIQPHHFSEEDRQVVKGSGLVRQKNWLAADGFRALSRPQRNSHVLPQTLWLYLLHAAGSFDPSPYCSVHSSMLHYLPLQHCFTLYGLILMQTDTVLRYK